MFETTADVLGGKVIRARLEGLVHSLSSRLPLQEALQSSTRPVRSRVNGVMWLAWLHKQNFADAPSVRTWCW
jgi:hypothetical protein